MNAILIDELKRLGLQYNEQQMLKRGEPLACLESVTKRLRRRQMWGMVYLTAMMVFPALMMCVSLVLRTVGHDQATSPHPIGFVLLSTAPSTLMLLMECVRQISRCETLALLAKLENDQPAATAGVAA